MSLNLSLADRIARGLIGFAVLGLVFFGPHTRWGFLGLILIATAVVGHCPIYRLFGVSTCHSPSRRAANA